MKKEDVSDIIGALDDDLIAAAGATFKVKKFPVKKWLAVAAAVALAVTAVLGLPRLMRGPSVVEPTSEPVSSEGPAKPAGLAVFEAVYPAYTDAAAHAAQVRSLTAQIRAEDETDFSFYTRVIGSLLSQYEGENAVFSPMSLYFGLCTLAEITEGETRAQLLSLLGEADVAAMRAGANRLWNEIYADETNLAGVVSKTLPANSFWLNDTARVNGSAEIAEILKNDYYTSFYKGDPADEAFAEALRRWINQSTGGLLENAVGAVDFPPETLFMLVNTLYYEARWSEVFKAEYNDTAPFHGAHGDTNAVFMRDEDCIFCRFYEGERFSALGRRTDNNSTFVWFLLPKDGYTLGDVLQSGEYAALFAALRQNDTSAFSPKEPEYEGYDLYLALPKFDVSGSFELKGLLQGLGVTDVFSEENASIPFLTLDGGSVYLDRVTQDARMTVDENGVSAAAVTVEGGLGEGERTLKRVEFIVDRPFLTLITAPDGAPMFAGIVSDVGEN